MMQGIMHNSPDIRQPCCYGLSMAAKVPEFAAAAPTAARNLVEVVTKTRALPKQKKHKQDQAVADNALSALIEIWLNHRQAIAAHQGDLLKCWVSGLPCQEDEEEGKKNHKFLLQFVRESNPEMQAFLG